MFLCMKTHCQSDSQTGSPELSAGCGSPECHVPYIIQNQYLTSCSPQTLWRSSVFSKTERGCNLRASEEPELFPQQPPPLLPPLFLFSSSMLLFLLLLFFFLRFSCLVHRDPLGLEWFSAECCIKSMNFIYLSLILFLCVCV